MKKVKMCEICGKNPAAVPDRDRMGRPIKRICLECQSIRLSGDFARIMEIREARKDEGLRD